MLSCCRLVVCTYPYVPIRTLRMLVALLKDGVKNGSRAWDEINFQMKMRHNKKIYDLKCLMQISLVRSHGNASSLFVSHLRSSASTFLSSSRIFYRRNFSI